MPGYDFLYGPIYKSGESFSITTTTVLTDGANMRERILLIGVDLGQLMALAMKLGLENDPDTAFTILGAPARSTPFTLAYAPLDLAPEVRTPAEDAWFRNEIGRREFVVRYVDFG